MIKTYDYLLNIIVCLILFLLLVLFFFSQLKTIHSEVQNKIIESLYSESKSELKQTVKKILNRNIFIRYLAGNIISNYKLWIMTNKLYFSIPVLKNLGFSLNEPDSNYETPLIYAARKNDFNFFYILIQNQADYLVKDKYGLTGIHWLIINKNLNFYFFMKFQKLMPKNIMYQKMLIFWKKLQNKTESFNVFESVKNNNICNLKACFAKNPNLINIKNKNDESLLYFSVKNQKLKVIELLILNGIDLNDFSGKMSSNPIHLSVELRNYELVFLLSKYINLNVKDLQRQSALHYAVKNNDYMMVKYLVSLGADIESADINHRTPLYIAVEYKRKKIASFLLSLGANRDIVKLDGTKLRDLM